MVPVTVEKIVEKPIEVEKIVKLPVSDDKSVRVELALALLTEKFIAELTRIKSMYPNL